MMTDAYAQTEQITNQFLTEHMAYLNELDDILSGRKTETVGLCDRVQHLAEGNSAQFKAKWAHIILNGFVDNVEQIIADCYEPLLTELPDPERTKRMLGEQCSQARNDFIVEVIRKLKNEGVFDCENMNCNEDDCDCWLDDFDDTAGGCDEQIWFAACELLGHAQC